MTGSLLVALVGAIAGAIWGSVTFLYIFFFLLAICYTVASFRVWRDEYNTRKKALEVHLSISPETAACQSPSFAQLCIHRIRINNSAKIGCKFRIQLRNIHPEIAGVFPPIPLEVPDSTDSQEGFIEGEGHAWANVLRVQPEHIAIASQTQVVLAKHRYILTIAVFVPDGASVSKEFVVDTRGGVVELFANGQPPLSSESDSEKA